MAPSVWARGARPLQLRSPPRAEFFRIGAAFAKCKQAQRIVTFREAHTRCVGHQFAVVKARRGQAKRAVEEQLASGRDKQISAAHYFGDAHRGIVHHDGELIARKIIMPPHHEIAEVLSGDKALRPARMDNERYWFVVGNLEPPTRARAGLRRSVPASAGIDRFIVCRVGRLKRLLNVPARANTRIDRAALVKSLERFTIKLGALRLIVRGVRTADVRAFVPPETKPFEVFI